MWIVDNMLENYIQKYQLFDKQQCKDILTEHKNAPWERHVWNTNTDNSNSSKDYDPSILYMDQKWGFMTYKYLEEKLLDYFKTVSDGTMYTHTFSPPRFNKYNVEQKMDYHVDHIHSLFDGQRKGIPILSIITLLNEDYEGGEFCFKLGDKEVEYEIKAGECLVWPSLFMYPHYVKPVTKGERQSFVVWAF